MLRKTLHSCLNNRSVSLNFFKLASCNFSTTPHYSDEQKSVLVDHVIKKPDTPKKWRLDSVLSVQQEDILNDIQQLQKLEDVLYFLQNNSDSIIVPLYSPVFDQIHSILRSKKSNIINEEFNRSREFEEFCIKVKKSARALRPNDIVNILKTLKLLKISSNSILFQSLLQVLSKFINELNLRELCFIMFLLHGAPSSPIVDAIRLSAPIVFDANVRIKLNHNDPLALLEAICFASRNKISDASTDIIVDAINHVRDRYTLLQIKDITLSLYRIKILNNRRKELLRFCLSKINKEMIDKLSITDVNALVTKMVNNFLFIHSYYYDEVFMSNVARYVVEKKLDLHSAGTILRTYNRISYVSADLLNYVDKNLKEANSDEFNDQFLLASFVSSCSDARYKPPNWMFYENNLIDFFLNIDVTNSIDVPLVRTVLELSSLQCWSKPLIEKVFDENFLRSYLSRDNNFLDHLVIMGLYQAVKTLYPGGYDGLLPCDDVISKAKEFIHKDRELILQPALETIFGGEKYVLNKVTSKYHHFIDHLLVVRKDGQPYPLKEEGARDGQDLEDIVLPQNSFPFAVLLLNPTAFCIDGVKLRGKVKLNFESIESFGVIVVPISAIVWESLQDFEKLPFLKREILSRIPATNSTHEGTDQIFVEE